MFYISFVFFLLKITELARIVQSRKAKATIFPLKVWVKEFAFA